MNIVFASVEPAIIASPSLSHSLLGDLSMDEFLNLKPKEITKRTGVKMNFLDRLVFRIVQKSMQKKVAKGDKNEKINHFDLEVGTFLMGLLTVIEFLREMTMRGFLPVLFALSGTALGIIALAMGSNGVLVIIGLILSMTPLLLYLLVMFLSLFFGFGGYTW